MKERLLIVGIACALSVGGWAGVYAAASCAHAARSAASPAAAAASHDCCRGRDGGESASCPVKLGESRGEPRQTKKVDGSASKARRGSVLASRAVLCAHCVGSRLPPPPPNRLGAPESPQRGDAGAPPRAEKLQAASPPVFVREVIPSQGAPPGRARLHVLNSVFLI